MSNYTTKTSVPVDAVPVTGTIIHDTSVPSGAARAIPITPNYTTTFGAQEISNDQIECYSLRKTVMILTGIDIFFSILYSIYNPYFFITTLLAVTGYYGAKNYNACVVFSYFVYITLDWLAKLSVYIIDATHEDPGTTGGAAVMWIFIIVSTLINMWISKIVYKFWRSLRTISILELAELKERELRRYHYVYW